MMARRILSIVVVMSMVMASLLGTGLSRARPSAGTGWEGVGPIKYDPNGSQYAGHYYAGADYGGNRTATSLSVTIQIPIFYPDVADTYYEILSAWDNHGSYDQIGYGTYLGQWEIVWLTSAPCFSSWTFVPNAFILQPAHVYTFGEAISSGVVHFSAHSGGAKVWSASSVTHGTRFLLEPWERCGSSRYYGYTNYEEVWNITNGPVPPIDIIFKNTTADAELVASDWSPFLENTTGILPIGAVVIDGANVTIDNVQY